MKKIILLSVMLMLSLNGCISGSNSQGSISFVTVERVSFGDTVVSTGMNSDKTTYTVVHELNKR